MIFAEKGKNDQSFIAVDEFAFLQTGEGCDFKPKEAVPTEPPPTTSTPEPTEPPSGKLNYKSVSLKKQHGQIYVLESVLV